MTDYKTSNNSGSDAFHQEDEDIFNYSDYRLEDWFAFILFWLLAITVFSQFVSRFIFSAPLGWTEEVARYELICLGFIGACMGVRKNSHIFVALFHRWLPLKISVVLYQVISMFNATFITILAYFAWQIMPQLHIHKMASVDIPISVLYGVVLASLLIMLVRSVQFVYLLFKHPDSVIEQEQLQEQSANCD